jgi:ribonuclease E
VAEPVVVVEEAAVAAPAPEPEPAPAAEPVVEDGPPKPKRKGWWSMGR